MSVPYALFSASGTGGHLEKIKENTKTGYRLLGSNPLNYGDIGTRAFDLSYSPFSSTTSGTTGDYATAIGQSTTASGYIAFAGGRDSKATGMVPQHWVVLQLHLVCIQLH
jgi:hypothetical protein